MITVQYKNEDNGQEVTFSITPNGDESATVNIYFDPQATNNIQDPYGILGKIAYIFTCKK